MLSLATAFTPQICFHVRVLCWSVSVCGCRVCPLVSSARVCCALLVLVVKKAQQTSRTSPAALLQKYIRATLPFPFLPSFRFGGRTVGRPVWEGAQQTHLGRNNAGQEKKTKNRHNSMDWRLARGLQTLVRWELASIHNCQIGKHSRDAWQVH